MVIRWTLGRLSPVKIMADSFYKLEDEAFPSFLCKSLDSTSGQATLGNVTLGSGPGLPVAASTVAKIKPASENRWGSGCGCCWQMWLVETFTESPNFTSRWFVVDLLFIAIKCSCNVNLWCLRANIECNTLNLRYVDGNFHLINIACCSYRLVWLCFVFLFNRGDAVEVSYLEGRDVSLQSAEQLNFALSLKDDLWVYVDV